MAAEISSVRGLGRATLARQLLLERSPLEPTSALKHLVGLQAQTPQSWYTGLWSRLVDFDAAAFGQLLEERLVVRMALMRSTIHLVAAEDAPGLRHLVQPVIERSTRGAFARAWAGLDADEVVALSLEELVIRYLAAFGPASVMDIQTWCGLTHLSEVVERLRPGLVVLRTDTGKELIDLPEAPRPPDDVPAPPRFLYDYDNLLLSHADRSRFSIHNLLDLGWSVTGAQPSCLLVDGRVEATWLVEANRGSVVLAITPLSPLGSSVRDEIANEGAGLLGFLGHDPAKADIQFRA